MFFGNVSEVEEGVAKLLETHGGRYESVRTTRPGIRFLVLDLTQVDGVDMSALEGLVRVRRMLDKRNVCLVVCGVKVGEGPVGLALESFFAESGHSAHQQEAGTSSGGPRVEVFDTFGDAMECEYRRLSTLSILKLCRD